MPLHRNGPPNDKSRDPGIAARAIVILLCVITAVSILLFGAVDSGALIVLALLILGVVVSWAWHCFRTGAITIEHINLLVPLIALAMIGIIQLLPLRSPNVPGGVLAEPVMASVSFDPYATRFFLMRLFLYIIFFAAALAFCNTLPRVRAIVTFLIVLGSFLAFYSILQKVEAPSAIYGLRAPEQAIPFGTYVNGHHFAALMQMTISLSLGLVFTGAVAKNRWPFWLLPRAYGYRTRLDKIAGG